MVNYRKMSYIVGKQNCKLYIYIYTYFMGSILFHFSCLKAIFFFLCGGGGHDTGWLEHLEGCFFPELLNSTATQIDSFGLFSERTELSKWEALRMRLLFLCSCYVLPLTRSALRNSIFFVNTDYCSFYELLCAKQDPVMFPCSPFSRYVLRNMATFLTMPALIILQCEKGPKEVERMKWLQSSCLFLSHSSGAEGVSLFLLIGLISYWPVLLWDGIPP